MRPINLCNDMSSKLRFIHYLDSYAEVNINESIYRKLDDIVNEALYILLTRKLLIQSEIQLEADLK